MPVETIMLTGDARLGIAPSSAMMLMAAANAAPETVKLGRTPPLPGFRDRCVHLSRFFSSGAPVLLPARVSWQDKAMDSITRMYRNDAQGCCVISGKAHFIGAVTGNDPDHVPAGVVECADSEIDQTYRNWCGPGDNGCNIENVLRRFVSDGMPFNGTRRKIDGYAAVDWTKRDLVKAAIYCLGGLCLGINLPSEWTNSAIWDVTSSRIVGGHDVQCVGYDDQGVQISSWGRIYTITWAAFLSTRWLEESWAMLAPDWYGADKKAPSFFDVVGLRQAMAAINQGNLPDDPTPIPVPTPPIPVPVPPTPIPVPSHERLKVVLTGSFPAGMWGTMTPVTLTGDAVPYPAGLTYGNGLDSAVAQLASSLRGAIPWTTILALVWKLAPIIAADLAAGKTPAQIAQDIIAALFSSANHEQKMAMKAVDWNQVFQAIKVLVDLLVSLFPAPTPAV